ncbi:Biopolymer transport protein ExbD/TolR [Bremerella volcania]|uniref:Biopolymer transport protein ExbD/TolR n=1 Tax=Bremerella volcania TaxID=2527984 RepID=A0A518C7L6_9BACT|nr:biopolymer transporter ExbD [Bremerella volcania]QDU75223.1 Biopolymer transport protein ExbD/TolR [Bremerella volcania]
MSNELIEIEEGEIMPARKRPQQGDLDITPMIDITFLLLIFFIVTSNLQKQTAAQMPQAKHGTTVSSLESAVITMTANEAEGRAVVYLGDGITPEARVEETDLNRQEEEITQYVERSFAGTTESGVPKRHLLIKADGKVPYGEVERVALAATRSGVVGTVERLYLGVQEKE